MNFVGLDFSTTAINEAKDRLPQFTSKIADVTNTQIREHGEIVICTEVIEHVDDPYEFAKGLINCCRPDGYLVITTQAGQIHATERAVGHLRHFTKAELSSILQEAGW
jgi:2-polyprenyl-3-methyl-5-hydroxy-6-metoxy-1,4-benzoquinol methylase